MSFYTETNFGFILFVTLKLDCRDRQTRMKYE